jgi:hypothetical protein
MFAAFIPQAQSAGPPPDKAKVVSVSGTVTPGYGSSLASGAALWVPATKEGSTENWAHLKLSTRNTPVEPILQAGVDPKNTEYTFACGITLGNTTVAWGLRQTSPWGCEAIDFTTWQWRSSTDTYLAEKTNTKASRKESEIAQQIPLRQGQVRVRRANNLTLINAYNLDGNLTIDVLVGAVTVESFESRRVNVSAGNRYIITGSGQDGTIETIDVARVVQSRSIQIFLDPSTWSRDITPLIQQFRRSLGIT